jgi:hypothetical protein
MAELNIKELAEMVADTVLDKFEYEGKTIREWVEELKAYKEQEPCNSCCGGDQREKAKLCQKSYLAGLEHRQEPCEDAISREAALEAILTRVPDFCGSDEDGNLIYRNETASYIRNLPSVTPERKTGHWFYDESIENWRCSECKETPKTIGYCGSANFMVEHFKFCNHCGAKMESEE